MRLTVGVANDTPTAFAEALEQADVLRQAESEAMRAAREQGELDMIEIKAEIQRFYGGPLTADEMRFVIDVGVNEGPLFTREQLAWLDANGYLG